MSLLLKENLQNLVALWHRYGADAHATRSVYSNASWPNRWWADWSIQADGSVIQDWPTPAALNERFEERGQPAVLSVWPSPPTSPPSTLERSLLATGWRDPFEQTAMVRDLNEDERQQPGRAPRSALTVSPLTVSPVQDERELVAWAALSRTAFGYDIDVSVLKPLLRDTSVSVFKAVRDDAMVATALLFRTGTTVGLHQMSVDPARQRQGVANALMSELERRSRASGARQMVLQASASGLPLYAKRGFVPQMTLRNYVRLPDSM